KLPGPGEADDFAGAVGSAGAFAGGGIGAAGAGRAGGTTGGTVLEVGLTAEGEASRADGTDDTVGGLDKSAVDVRWAVAPVAVAVAGAAAAAGPAAEAAGAALTGALASTGASTGRSVKGSNTGRDAASIV